MMPAYRHMWEFASNVALKVNYFHTLYLKTTPFQFAKWTKKKNIETNERLNIVSSLLFMLKPSQKDANYFWWNILVKQRFYQTCMCIFTTLLSLAHIRFLSPTYFSISVVAVDIFVCFHFCYSHLQTLNLYESLDLYIHG